MSIICLWYIFNVFWFASELWDYWNVILLALQPTDESERAQAKLKGLDETGPVAVPAKPHKDVNTFINNQLKFVSAPTAIPPDQMKCNILKAQAEEQYANTGEAGTILELQNCQLISFQYLLSTSALPRLTRCLGALQS